MTLSKHSLVPSINQLIACQPILLIKLLDYLMIINDNSNLLLTLINKLNYYYYYYCYLRMINS